MLGRTWAARSQPVFVRGEKGTVDLVASGSEKKDSERANWASMADSGIPWSVSVKNPLLSAAEIRDAVMLSMRASKSRREMRGISRLVYLVVVVSAMMVILLLEDGIREVGKYVSMKVNR